MQLSNYVNENEKILWQDKPYSKCVLFECIFNSGLVFSIAWGIFSYLMLTKGGWNNVLRDINSEQETFKFAIRILICLYSVGPILIYIINIFSSYLRAKSISYIVTDQAIYLGYGIFSFNCRRKSFMEFSHINIHIGVLDKMFGTADIILSNKESFMYRRKGAFGYNDRSSFGLFDLINIKDYEKIFKLIKDLQTDVYSDVMYPNDLRPEYNHGYRSKIV